MDGFSINLQDMFTTVQGTDEDRLNFGDVRDLEDLTFALPKINGQEQRSTIEQW